MQRKKKYNLYQQLKFIRESVMTAISQHKFLALFLMVFNFNGIRMLSILLSYISTDIPTYLMLKYFEYSFENVIIITICFIDEK